MTTTGMVRDEVQRIAINIKKLVLKCGRRCPRRMYVNSGSGPNVSLSRCLRWLRLLLGEDWRVTLQSVQKPFCEMRLSWAEQRYDEATGIPGAVAPADPFTVIADWRLLHADSLEFVDCLSLIRFFCFMRRFWNHIFTCTACSRCTENTSYCEINMFNLVAVRHLGFDRKWIVTTLWKVMTHQLIRF